MTTHTRYATETLDLLTARPRAGLLARSQLPTVVDYDCRPVRVTPWLRLAFRLAPLWRLCVAMRLV